MITVGGEVYPEPCKTGVIAVTVSALIVVILAIAEAPEPVVSPGARVRITVGADL